jgi:cysteine desulfurase / selenocysteine lyase
MTIDFKTIREREFVATQTGIHLKASGGSPMCLSAFRAGEAYLKEMCFEGDLYYDKYIKGVDHARRLTAEYINARPEEIGFQVNSSSGAAVMAAMLERMGTTRVYFPVGEFPTSVHALMNRGIEVIPVGDPGLRDSSGAWLDAIARSLDGGARQKSALVASHVCFLSGTAVDLEAYGRFCRDRQLTFVVNATQSFGALEIDVGENIDMLFATGLKWASAGYGAGFLYLRQSLVDAFGLPGGTGWLSVHHPYQMDHRNAAPLPSARSLDAGGGMPHFGPLLSLEGALGLYGRIGGGDIRAGVRAVQARTLLLAAYLRDGLAKAGFDILGDISSPPKSGIVSVVSARAGALFDALKARRILTSLRSFPGDSDKRIVRFGVHFFNTEEELDAALEVVRSAG